MARRTSKLNSEECEQAIEAHKVLARNARSEEEAQVHYMHIPDLQDFINALREFGSKVRNEEIAL